MENNHSGTTNESFLTDSYDNYPVTEVRKIISGLIERVKFYRDRVIITKNDRPAVAMVPIEDLRKLIELDDQVDRELLKETTDTLSDRSVESIPIDEFMKKIPDNFLNLESEQDIKSLTIRIGQNLASENIKIRRAKTINEYRNPEPRQGTIQLPEILYQMSVGKFVEMLSSMDEIQDENDRNVTRRAISDLD